jgi:hypothetical protein
MRRPYWKRRRRKNYPEKHDGLRNRRSDTTSGRLTLLGTLVQLGNMVVCSIMVLYNGPRAVQNMCLGTVAGRERDPVQRRI